jgi:hypothetical protein
VLAAANLALAGALVLALYRQARVNAEAATLESAALARATNLAPGAVSAETLLYWISGSTSLEKGESHEAPS